MTWSWRMESTDGGTVDGVPSERFPSQADAESWVGEAWQDLLSQGVDAVSLLEDDRVVYGPSSPPGVDHVRRAPRSTTYGRRAGTSPGGCASGCTDRPRKADGPGATPET